MSSFSIALSGLTADSAALDVVGNNLANLNTTGYKDSTVSFYDLLQQSVAGGTTQIGGGVSAPQTERLFTQGSITSTGGNYDAAINGNGFFVVQDPSGNTLYTRAGNFNLNAQGDLVTATGQFVQGWTAQNGVVDTSGAIGDITIPSNALQTPSATQNMSLSVNLNAAGVVNGTTGTFTAPITVVDSLGVSHDLSVVFTEQSPGTWGYSVNIPGADLTSGTPGTPSSVTTGTLTFDSNGNLTSPTAPAVVPINITGLADGASDMNINWNLATEAGNGTPVITQYAAASTESAATQDGVPASQVTQVSIANGGAITAQFSNGNQVVVGQLALASVSNPDSLIAVGQNNYEVGADTATPTVGVPNTGTLGTVEGGALEDSTVDIATEFTNLIVYQNSYDANSKVISTLDEMTQALLSLKQ
ncbi:MAG TPA: flagellar hook protein FlgE [Bryobacteraceae bacterium]|jgi:flagellar hook protein FlgE|nr:flagellar hook protein FlgE [Bryobacteraceae bacterium]